MKRFLTILFLAGTLALSAQAQSDDLSDYHPIVRNYGGNDYFIDSTSVEYIRGNAYYWLMVINRRDEVVLWMSIEMACKTRRNRIRHIVASNGDPDSYINRRYRTAWLRADVVSSRGAKYVCD